MAPTWTQFMKTKTNRGGSRIRPLSPREREIVSLIWKAYSNDNMAKALGISIRTVETHRTNAMKKLGVKNRVQLIRPVCRKT